MLVPGMNNISIMVVRGVFARSCHTERAQEFFQVGARANIYIYIYIYIYIGGSRGGVQGVRTPLFYIKKFIAIACQRGTKALPLLRNDRRSQLSLIMYEFFSSSPTFSYTVTDI